LSIKPVPINGGQKLILKIVAYFLGVVVMATKTKRGGKFQYVLKKKGLLKKPVYKASRTR
jgi:hypothetical protein